MPLKAKADRGIFDKRNTLRSKRQMQQKQGNLLRVVQEQQETIEKQGRLIADLVAALEQWEEIAGYDGVEMKERAARLQ